MNSFRKNEGSGAYPTLKCVSFAVAALLICSGCASNNVETPESTAPVTDIHQEDTFNSPAAIEETVGVKRVGEVHYGFWDIPQNWYIFHELDAAEGDNMIQYSDMGGQNIITVRYFADLDQTPEVLLNAQGQYMEDIGGEGITGATVQLNGIDALQIYGSFPDDTIMVSWAFESEDGELHLIIAEGPTATIFETVGYLESSYALED